MFLNARINFWLKLGNFFLKLSGYPASYHGRLLAKRYAKATNHLPDVPDEPMPSVKNDVYDNLTATVDGRTGWIRKCGKGWVAYGPEPGQSHWFGSPPWQEDSKLRASIQVKDWLK